MTASVKKKKKTSKINKAAIIGLSILSVVVLFVWSSNFKNNLNKHFEPETGADSGYQQSLSSSECPGGSCPNAQEANPNFRDTDKDGLSDADELEIYGTSPYLQDTDSDGINDKTELEAGTNPACLGENCGIGNPITDEKMKIEEAEVAEEMEEEFDTETLEGSIRSMSLEVNEGQVSEVELMNILQGKGDVDLLRKALISSGMDKNLLDQIGDKALMESYQRQLENYSEDQ